MTKEEIISGLKRVIEICVIDPLTGDIYDEPHNDEDAMIVEACKGAIKLLEKEENSGKSVANL